MDLLLDRSPLNADYLYLLRSLGAFCVLIIALIGVNVYCRLKPIRIPHVPYLDDDRFLGYIHLIGNKKEKCINLGF